MFYVIFEKKDVNIKNKMLSLCVIWVCRKNIFAKEINLHKPLMWVI